MAEPTANRRSKVEQALKSMLQLPLTDGLTGLLAALGYQSEKTANLGSTPQEFVSNLQQ